MKTLIVGVGSILRGDDGIGPRVIDELEKEVLPEEVTLHSGDISGLDLLKVFPGNDRIIIIDAADIGEKPGAIKVFRPSEIKSPGFNDQFSTHGMALPETLALAEQIEIKNEILIVGVQPEETGYSLEITDILRASVPSIVRAVKELL